MAYLVSGFEVSIPFVEWSSSYQLFARFSLIPPPLLRVIDCSQLLLLLLLLLLDYDRVRGEQLTPKYVVSHFSPAQLILNLFPPSPFSPVSPPPPSLLSAGEAEKATTKPNPEQSFAFNLNLYLQSQQDTRP